MDDPSLLLSPHFFLLAVLTKNKSFEVESLNNNFLKLLTLKVSPNANEMRVRIKDKLQDVPLFRHSKRTIRGYEMSLNPITKTVTNLWMQKVGKECGFEHNSTAYTLRYFASNSLDQNRECNSCRCCRFVFCHLSVLSPSRATTVYQQPLVRAWADF